MLVHVLHNPVMDQAWFKARKKEVGVTNDAIAAEIGRHVSVVSKILNGKSGLEFEHIDGFARALQVNREEILRRAGILDANGSSPLLATNAKPIELEGASLNEPRPNLPVYGSALGASRTVEGDAIELTTLNRADVIEYAKRPPLLNRRPKAYGLYVQGSSMHPALPDGEMVAVVPEMPLSNGDNVVLYLRPVDPNDDDGETARAVLIKELVKRTATHYVLRQYQPALEFTIEKDEVLRVDRVLTRREMMS